MWVDSQTGGTLLWNPCGPSTTVWTTFSSRSNARVAPRRASSNQVPSLNSTLTV